MHTPDELLAAARTLSPGDQWTLVTKLWQSLPEEAWSLSDADISEFDKRCVDVDAGDVRTLSRGEVSQRLQALVFGNG